MEKRVKIIFSYDGSKFFGSQIQKHEKQTVMGRLQRAIKTLGIDKIAQSSGRTDRGVHALNQVCHLDIPNHFLNLNKLRKNLNYLVMPYIYIKSIAFVNSNFHARFSAKKRLYRYIVSHKPYNPIFADYYCFMPSIDLDILNENIKEFEGSHNFSYFKKQGSITHNDTRTIYRAFAYQKKGYTIINFLGNGFLRSQIRIMCDFLFKIQRGELGKEDLIQQLRVEKKEQISLAPPAGLYLSRIYY